LRRQRSAVSRLLQGSLRMRRACNCKGLHRPVHTYTRQTGRRGNHPLCCHTATGLSGSIRFGTDSKGDYKAKAVVLPKVQYADLWPF
ncbi:MAG: hypothetical protein P4L69_05525, partial [Desulfosporosinus sp.]|nr:hypothetical protein [Desulfosporosinus sp.]